MDLVSRPLSPYANALSQRILDDVYFLGTGLVDFWLPINSRLTNVSGKASAWTGIKKGLTWVQASSPNRPTISNYAGVPSLFFDGSDDFMDLPPGHPLTNNVPGFTIATAYTLVPSAGSLTPVGFTNAYSEARVISFVSPTAFSTQFTRLDTDAPLSCSVTLTSAARTIYTHISSADYTAGKGRTYINGRVNEISLASSGNSDSTDSPDVWVGKYYAGYQGHVLALALFTAGLTIPQMQRLGGILAWAVGGQSRLVGSYANIPPMLGG
jgi:hypothetical protein